MPDQPRNIGASVRARLLKLAKQRNQPLDLLLTRYVLERFLYRLASTKHRDRFVLKGAMLIRTWLDEPFRPTRDLDLLGFGDAEPTALLNIFKEVCAIATPDAVVFDIPSLGIDLIREENEYGGLRIKGNATVDGARVRVLIDVAFGDAIEPGLEEAELPVLLDFPAPRLRSYPREAVIAEKLQAMVVLGRANSRMKDFYDIWVLSQSYEFEGDALAATFARRKTDVPTEHPDALSSAFAGDVLKQEQWAAFIRDLAVRPDSLAEVVESVADFLMPHIIEARKLTDRSQ